MDEREVATLLRGAAVETLRALSTSRGLGKLLLEEGQFHTGDDPIEADRDAQAVFERAVDAARPLDLQLVALVGEERIKELPTNYAPGDRVIVVDPLDGSTQWATFFQMYCVAAYALIADDRGQLTIEAAVVANTQHTFSWVAGASGMTLHPTDGGAALTFASVVPETALDDPSLSYGGFKVKDRGASLEIQRRLDQWSIYTLGGNSVTPYVVVGNLTAALNLRAQTIWDALGVLIASSTDAVVGSLSGDILPHVALRALFGRVLVTGDVRKVPALLIAKSEARYHELVAALAPLVDERGEISPAHHFGS